MIATKIRPKTLNEVQPDSLAKLTPATRDENPIIGPTITGIILGALSWRDIFFIFTVLLVIGLLFAIFTLENVNKITRPHVDVLSVLGSIIGFSSLVAGVSFASESGWTSFKVLGL